MIGGSMPPTTTLAEREAARTKSNPLNGVRHPDADPKPYSMIDRVEPTRPVSQVPQTAVAVPERPKKIERNLKGLVEALFDEIDMLRDGTGSADRIRVICSVAAQVAALVNTEMKLRKMAGVIDTSGERVKAITG